jgi:hypothetical protein
MMLVMPQKMSSTFPGTKCKMKPLVDARIKPPAAHGANHRAVVSGDL